MPPSPNNLDRENITRNQRISDKKNESVIIVLRYFTLYAIPKTSNEEVLKQFREEMKLFCTNKCQCHDR